MKLGDVDTPRTRKRVDDAADREEVKYYKKHRRTALQESTDRRLIMMGSASGACTVIEERSAEVPCDARLPGARGQSY